MSTNNFKSAAHSSFIYGLGNLATKIVGLVLLPLYTKHFTLEDYGILSILEVTVQFLVATFSIGLYQAFFRWYWERKDNIYQKSIFFTCLVFVGLLSAIMLVLLYPFAGRFSHFLFETSNLTYVFKLMLTSTALQIVGQIPSTLLRLQEKAFFFSAANIIKLFFTLVLTVIFISYYGKGIEGIFEAQVIGHLVFLIFLTPYSIKNIFPRFLFYEIKAMLIYSVPLVFASIFGVVLTVTDRYALDFIVGPADTGIYSLGFRIANTLNIFIVTSVNLAIQPMIFRMADTDEGKKFQVRILKYMTFVLMILIIGLSAFGLELLQIVSLNADYIVAYTIIPIISFSIFFSMMKDIVIIGINIRKKTNIIGIVIVMTALLNLGLNITFIPIWNSIGAAYATLVTQFIYFISVYYFSQKLYPLSYEIKNILLVAIFGGILVILSQMLNPINIFWRIPLKLFLVILLPVILYPFNFYNKQEITGIKNIWTKWKNPHDIGRNIKDLLH